MAETYEKNVFQGYILQGNLKAALAYLEKFPNQAALYDWYVKLFTEEPGYCGQGPDHSEQEPGCTEQGTGWFKREPIRSECIDPELEAIFLCYQKYYRDVFYRELDAAGAEARLRGRFEALFGAGDAASLDEFEERQVAAAFREKGYFFLGGRTSGYYGPYVWKTEELKQYSVELPDGTQEYAVKLLDGFLSKSWIDYLTFGEIPTAQIQAAA